MRGELSVATAHLARWWTRLAALATAALLVAAVGSAGSAATALALTRASHAQKPKNGGTVTYALPSLTAINWFQPLRPESANSAYDADIASMMYKDLLYVGSDGKIDYSQSVASGITYNKQGTEYTVTLNPKWHWSDGSPVTSADVLFSWQLIQAASSTSAPAPWPYAGDGQGGIPTDIKSVETLSPTKFRVTTTIPLNQQWFEYNGLSQLEPLPKKAWDKYPGNIQQELAYVAKNGTTVSFFKVIDGPFFMKSAVPNQAWTFTPNKKYSGSKPHLSKVVFEYTTSDASEVSSLQTGSIGIGYLPVANYSIQDQLSAYTLIKSYDEGFARTFLNSGSPTVGSLLKELPVRQALQMGVDQATMVKSIYQGLAIAGNGPVPSKPDTFMAPQLRKKLAYKYDPAAGKKLLQQNGFHEVGGVMQNAQGQQLSFQMQYVSGPTATLQSVQLMQQDWAKEGIKVSLVPMPFANMLDYHTVSAASKWEIQAGISYGYGGAYPTGETQYETGAGQNFFQFSDPKLDQLIKATNEPHATPAESQQALYNYDLAVTKDLPALWAPLAANLTEVNKNVHGFTNHFNAFTGALSPEYWWVS